MDAATLLLAKKHTNKRVPWVSAAEYNGDIQAAINAISAIGGGIVVVPWQLAPYLVTGLTLDSNLRLLGLGKPTIKLADGANANVLHATSKSNITVENFNIDVNGVNQNSALYPAYVNAGWYFADIDGITLKNVSVNNSIRDNKLLRCTDIYCENVHVDGAQVDGWSIDNCNGGVFRNVSAKNITGVLAADVNGFEIEDGSRNLSFYDVFTENCSIGSGILFKSHDGINTCKNISMHNVKSINNFYGVNIAGFSEKVYIDGLQIVSANHGLLIGEGANIVNVNNLDVESAERALNLGSNCYNVRLSGRKLKGKYGVYAGSSVAEFKNVDISDMIIEGTDQTLYLAAHTAIREKVSFRNCEILSTGNSTIWCMGGTWDRLVFNNCKIRIPSGARRLIIDNSRGIDFINCDIDSLSARAISLRYSVNDIKIKGGKIKATTTGIDVLGEVAPTGASSDIIIDGVDIADMTNLIQVRSDTANKLTNLKVSDCRFKNGNMINWAGDQNPDIVTLTNNVGQNVTYAGPTSGTNIVKSGNNPAI